MLWLCVLLLAAPLADVDDFGKQIETWVNTSSVAPFRARFDLEAAADRALANQQMNAEFRRGFLRGASERFDLFEQLRQVSGYRYLGARSQPDGHILVFRLLPRDGGVNYHEWLVQQRPDGWRVIDFFNHIGGEWLTVAWNRLLQPVLVDAKKSRLRRWWDRWRGNVDPEQQLLQMLGQVDQLLRAQDFAGALRLLEAAPEPLRHQRIFLAARLNCSLNVSDEAYERTAAVIEAHFPDDPSFELALFDHYFNKERYPRALHALDIVAGRVFNDAYIQYLSGLVLLKMKREGDAKAAFEASVAREPTLQEPYWQLTELAMSAQDWAELRRLLYRVHVDAGVELQDLRQVAGYEAFVKTSEYRELVRQLQAP